MTFHHVAYGVHFEFSVTWTDEHQPELWLEGDPILQDADEWHEMTTAHPFTVDGVRDWWEAEGVFDRGFEKAAIEWAQDSRV